MPDSTGPDDKNKGFGIKDVLAPIAGFGVTFKTMFKPIVTEQ